MKLRLLFLTTVLLIVWSIPPTAHGFPPRKGKIFQELSDQTLPTPTKDTAVIVFVLPTDGGDMVGGLLIHGLGKKYSLIYDVTSETPKVLGAIRRGLKIAYEVPAGKHMFKSTNLLALNVVAGKTYYVHADDPGFAAGHATRLAPVRNGGEGKYQYSSESFQRALVNTVLVDTSTKTKQYFGKGIWLRNANRGKEKLLKKWETKTENERQELTLNVEDGISADVSDGG